MHVALKQGESTAYQKAAHSKVVKNSRSVDIGVQWTNTDPQAEGE